MARIPDGEIERLKHEVDLAALVAGSGVSLRRHGANGDLIGRCPFHDDHEPSLVISPKGPAEADLWHCLGACQAGGTVFDWVMKAQKVSFRHAAEILLAQDDYDAAREAIDVVRRDPRATNFIDVRARRLVEAIERVEREER